MIKKFSLNNLLQNNKFLLVFSVLISLAIWIYMSMGTSNDTTVTVSNIPIQIELSDDAIDNGLQIFSGGDTTASVTVSGNRTVLGSISESDITVTAAASTIDSSGTYTLDVSATKANSYKEFQIISSVSPSTVTVVADYMRESTFDIQDNVVYQVADGYYASVSLASKTIEISGPQTEISKISKVAAVAEVENKTLTDSLTVDADIILYDEDGEELSTDLITMNLTSVEATISVLPEKEVTVEPTFVNMPQGLTADDLNITLEPSTIVLAGPQSVLDETDSVYLEQIDFSTLDNEKQTFSALGIDIPTDCKNLSNTTTAEVTVDLSGFATKSFEVTDFTVDGLSSDYTSSVTQNSITVTVIGPEDEIEALEAGNITGVIDASDSNGTTGSVQMPVSFTFDNASGCWAYGSYKANLTISQKS